MKMYLELMRDIETLARAILKQNGKAASHQLACTAKGGATASVNVETYGTHHTVTLNMPSLPADLVMQPAEADRLVGYVLHEMCHVTRTTWDRWRDAVAAGERVRSYTNGIEDVWIEREEIAGGVYPAARSVLSSLMDHVHYEGVQACAAAGQTIGQTLADAPYVIAVLGRLANGYTIHTARGLLDSLHPLVRQVVDVGLRELPQVRDTAGALRLARKLAALENQLAQAEREKQQADQGDQGKEQADQGGQGNQGDQSSQGGRRSQERPQGDQGGQEGKEGGQEGKEGKEGQEGGQGGQQDGKGAGGKPNPASTEGGRPTDNMLGDLVRQVTDRTGTPEPVEGNQGLNGYITHRKTPPVPYSPYSAESMAKSMQGGLTQTAVLHGQLSRLLMSVDQTHTTHHETSGRLDRRALCRMTTGAQDVFTRRRHEAGIETALAILVDTSSSMCSGNRQWSARVTAWHLAKAAVSAGAKVTVQAFTDQLAPRGRVASVGLVEVLGFGQPLEPHAARFGLLGAAGTTPLSPGILAAAEMLREVDANRRIIMVLTDGACNYGARNVTSACNIAAAWGVEVVAIGMECDTVIKAFPAGHSVNVEDLSQLGGTGLGALCAMLEEGIPDAAD